MLQAWRIMVLIVVLGVPGGAPAQAAVRVAFDAARAGSGVEPNEVTLPWVLYGTPMSNDGGFLLQNNTADDPTTQSGEYLSPSAGGGLMTYGSGQYGIEFRVRPLTDVPTLGSSHYANLAVTWSDSLYSYNVTIDKDTNDASSGTTGGLRYGQNSMINAVTGLDWSVPHTVFVGYRGGANAFDFYVDGTLAATIPGGSMARTGSWARDAVDFGDGTVGQGLDISAEWYFVRVHDTAAPAPAVHVPFADADGDGDVDQGDFGALQACLTGAGGGVAAGCEAFDRAETGFPGGDRDVDQDDLDAFVQCYSGAGVPANPGCELRTPATGRNYLALYTSLKATGAEVDALINQARSNGIATLVPSLSGSGATVGFVTAKEGYLPELVDRLAAGFDALGVMIEHAHAAGLKVVPSVAVGPVNLMLFGHPEWETRDRNGQASGATLAPSLAFSYPLARQVKLSMLMDLVGRYNIDGVFLDYLRYPENTNPQHPEYACGFYGYDQPLVQQCIAQYGFDPRLEPVGTSNWNRFNALRINSVTAFAQEFRTAVAASGRSIAIGGFGDSTLANDTCAARDWSAWARGGWIDELWLGNYVVSIANMRQVLSQTRQLTGPNVVIKGALSPYAGFLGTNAQMVQAAREMLLGGAGSLWIYREDALVAGNLWVGAGLANEKYIRMTKLTGVPAVQYDAVAAGGGVEPNEIAPAWVLSGSRGMVNNGSCLLQNNTSSPAAETGVYQSPAQPGLMLRFGGNYSIEFRVRPLADISSAAGSSDYANLHLAWADDVFRYSVAIDADSDDAGPAVTGGLLVGGTAAGVAVSQIDWATPHTVRVVYDGVDAEFYFYLDGNLVNALAASQVQAGADSLSLQDRVQFGDSTPAGNDSMCEWYFVRSGANHYVP